jgi:hypothetical protein
MTYGSKRLVVLGMAAAAILTDNFNIYYNMSTIFVASFPDSLAGCALATAGLAFSTVALLKITWIACHNIFHAVARHWHFTAGWRGTSPSKP